MKYSCDTLKKFLKQAKEAIAFYNALPVQSLHLAISSGNSKIGNALNVSLMPVISCGNCRQCMFYCYDIKACMQYKNVMNARARNQSILERDRDFFFEEIENALNKRRSNKFMRWQESGEIPDLDYFVRMVDKAKNHPDFIFWTYTKMYDIINTYCDMYGKNSIPENLSVMFSKWDGLEMHNPYGFPVFAVKMINGNIDYIPFENYYECPGNCDICKKVKRGCIDGENTFANEH